MVRAQGTIFPRLGIGLVTICCIYIHCVRADNDGPASQRRLSCKQSLRRCQRNSHGANNGEVCGSDGRTYLSHCSLLFAACRRQNSPQGRGRSPRLRLVHAGACQDDTYYDIRNKTDVVAGRGGGTLPVGSSQGSAVAFDKEEREEDEGEEEEEEEEEDEEWRFGDSISNSDEEDDSEEEDEDNDGKPFNPATRPPTVSSAVTSLPAATTVFPTTGFTSPSVSNQPTPTLPTDRTVGLTGTARRTEPTTAAPTCAPSCPLDSSNPVCGTDGETYSSQCLLEAHACQTGDQSLIVLYDGPCVAADAVVPLPRRDATTPASRRQPRPTPADRPVRERLSYCPTEAECSMLYLPVCGSDGTTYSSWCHLRLVACSGAPYDELTVSHRGECPENTNTGCGESCPYVFEPVCGSDNKTYHSPCSLRRISCSRGEDLPTVLHDGECNLPPLVCPLACHGINDPVCGTDGNSYPSLCVIRLVACRSADEKEKLLRVSYRGLCMNEPCQNSCPEREYAPLCGSNGRTYQNECFLWLEMCRNSDLVRFDKDCNLAIP